MVCLGPLQIVRASDNDVIMRLWNAGDSAETPVIDATASFSLFDDTNTDVGTAMAYNASYEAQGITGWYVGVAPASASLTAEVAYTVTYKASGGSLNGTLSKDEEVTCVS